MKVKMKIKMLWLRFWLALAFIVLVAHIWSVACTCRIVCGLSVPCWCG